MRINPKQHERIEVILDGKVYVMAIHRNRPQLVFSHLLREEVDAH